MQWVCLLLNFNTLLKVGKLISIYGVPSLKKVRIYQPTKTAMQSGRSNLGSWVLEYEPITAKRADPLMGWIGSNDTSDQVKMCFQTRDEAVVFAKKNNLDFSIIEPKTRKIQPKDYSANFAYDRVYK